MYNTTALADLDYILSGRLLVTFLGGPDCEQIAAGAVDGGAPGMVILPSPDRPILEAVRACRENRANPKTRLLVGRTDDPSVVEALADLVDGFVSVKFNRPVAEAIAKREKVHLINAPSGELAQWATIIEWNTARGLVAANPVSLFPFELKDLSGRNAVYEAIDIPGVVNIAVGDYELEEMKKIFGSRGIQAVACPIKATTWMAAKSYVRDLVSVVRDASAAN